MKGIAIGLSNTSKVILKRLKKTEFINEIYIASSTYEKKNEDNLIPFIKPKEVFKEKWKDLDLIIFIGSIGASIRLINSFLTSKDKDPGVIVIDKKGFINLMEAPIDPIKIIRSKFFSSFSIISLGLTKGIRFSSIFSSYVELAI